MTDFYTLVCQTAAKLQAEGKNPSLALIRAHAGKGCDPAALFSAYQQWRTNPPATKPQPAVETTTELDCIAAESVKDNEINALRQEIAQLHAKVDRLVLAVEKLSLQSDVADVRR